MTALERFTELIRQPTVSSFDPKEEDNAVFKRFPELLAKLYPSAHKAMERELIGDRSIVYCWRGSNPSLEPVLGMAHYDVVPPGNPDNWERPAFSGEIAEGRIFGRDEETSGIRGAEKTASVFAVIFLAIAVKVGFGPF